MKLKHLLAAVSTLSLVAFSFPAQATISWDSLPSGTGVYVTPGSPTYGGYNFFDGDGSFGSIGNGGPLQYTLPGNPLSGGSAAYNAWGDTPIRVESLNPTPGEAFTFSGWFSGQQNLGSGAAQVEVEGFTGTSSTPSFTTTFSLPSDGSWVHEDLTASGALNKFLFSPLDSSGNPSAYVGGYIYMDDVQLSGASAVPEPATVISGVLLLFPFGLSTVRQLRKRKGSSPES
jgi:hypothetical protein